MLACLIFSLARDEAETLRFSTRPRSVHPATASRPMHDASCQGPHQAQQAAIDRDVARASENSSAVGVDSRLLRKPRCTQKNKTWRRRGKGQNHSCREQAHSRAERRRLCIVASRQTREVQHVGIAASCLIACLLDFCLGFTRSFLALCMLSLSSCTRKRRKPAFAFLLSRPT